jgi:hypothetical protein
MSHLAKHNHGTSLRNIAITHKDTKTNNNATHKRKSYGSLKMMIGTFKIPTVMHMQTESSRQKVKNTKTGRRVSDRYGSIFNQSSSMPRDSIGEYSYGNRGASFGKTAKKSKFDEDKERVYSPGPGRYEQKSKRVTMYSFGKSKKNFSFVKANSKDIPSPGKYNVRRDFLSGHYSKRKSA